MAFIHAVTFFSTRGYIIFSLRIFLMYREGSLNPKPAGLYTTNVSSSLPSAG